MDITVNHLNVFGITITEVSAVAEDGTSIKAFGSSHMPNLEKLLTARVRQELARNTPLS